MKKLMLVAAVAVFGLSNVNAQSFNVGISAGLPIGDAGDLYSFSAIVDANYLWAVSDQFDAGIAAGYSHSFGKDIDLYGGGSVKVDGAGFIPVGAAGRFNATEDFTIGLDLGYGIAVSPSGSEGAFYYAPKLQYTVADNIDLVLAYRALTKNGGSFDILSFGVEFGL